MCKLVILTFKNESYVQQYIHNKNFPKHMDLWSSKISTRRNHPGVDQFYPVLATPNRQIPKHIVHEH